MNREQLERYSRHILLNGMGQKGQEKLLASSVLIVGAGGLGSPAAMYLAAAGVGKIGIVDDDNVDLTNMQRQIIHSVDAIGTPKALSAKKRIGTINPDVAVETYESRLTAKNVKTIFNEYDFILDATDNFETKFLINDTCVEMGKPFSYGGIQEFSGQLMTYVPGEGPCYRCIFEEPPEPGVVPTCREVGVIGCMAGIIGTLQSMEVIKYLLGSGELLTGQLLTVDALTMEFRKVKFAKRNPDCPVCGKRAGEK